MGTRPPGWLSFLTFGHVGGLLSIGGLRQYTSDDVPPLWQNDATEVTCERFSSALDEEVMGHTKADRSLLRALHRSLLSPLYWLGILKMVELILTPLQPLLMKRFIEYMENPSGRDLNDGVLIGASIVFVQLIGALCTQHFRFGARRVGLRTKSALVSAVFRRSMQRGALTASHQSDKHPPKGHTTTRGGGPPSSSRRMSNADLSDADASDVTESTPLLPPREAPPDGGSGGRPAITKNLTDTTRSSKHHESDEDTEVEVMAVAAASRVTLSSGELNDFISVDTHRVGEAINDFHELWSKPIKVLINFTFLYRELNNQTSFWIVLTVVLLLVAVNGLILSRIQHLIRRMMLFRDARLRASKEILQNIRTVKMLSWEQHAYQRIDRMRSNELRRFGAQTYLSACSKFLFVCTPAVVKLATVITIVLQSGSLQSTSSTYTTFAFIERFLNAINDIPRVLKLFIIAQVSIRRLSDFLLQDDRVEAPASTRSGTGGRQGAPSLPQRPTPSPSLPPVSSDGYYLPDGRQGRGGPGEGGSDVDGFQSACEHDTEPEPEALRRMRPRGLTSSSASLVATESLPPADRVSLSNPSRLRSSSVYSQGERPDVSSAVEDVFYDVDEGHVTDAVQVPQTSRARTATTGDLDLTVGPLRTQRARPAKRHPVIDFRDASFSWRPPSRDASTGANTAGSLALREIRMRVMEGDLIVVLGPSGAGKSSLLASFLGEMNLAEGRASVTIRGHSGGGVGYAPQSPWIVAGTIRENIIFRRPFHPEAYEKIIDAVCLREDLAEFVAGDLTEIEGGGHSLSGGQRARISLARAVYAASLANEDQGTEISQQLFLIDDPFASLDATTTRKVWQAVFQFPNGILWGHHTSAAGGRTGRHRTCVLVAHALGAFLADPSISRIIVLRAGRVAAAGRFHELQRRGTPEVLYDFSGPDLPRVSLIKRGSFPSLSAYAGPAKKNESSGMTLVAAPSVPRIARDFSVGSVQAYAGEVRVTFPPGHRGKRQQDTKTNAGARLVEPEERHRGSVGFEVYWWYFRTSHILGVLFIVLCSSWMAASCPNLLEFVVGLWTSGRAPPFGRYMGFHWFEQRGWMQYFYLLIYCGVALSMLGASFVGIFGFAACFLWASREVHDQLLRSVICAPSHWFDRTPVGRVMNRLSDDIFTVDEFLPSTLQITIGAAASLWSTVCLLAAAVPLLIFVLPFISLIYLKIAFLYGGRMREIKRLENVSRSPIYGTLSDLLTGITIIRAFRAEERYFAEYKKHVEENQRIGFANYCLEGWFSLRLELIGVVWTFSIISLSLAPLFFGFGMRLESSTLVSQAAGTALALYATNRIVFLMSHTIRMATTVERHMVSIERLWEYATMERENGLTNLSSLSSNVLATKLTKSQKGRDQRKMQQQQLSNSIRTWQAVSGAIEFRNVTLRYRPACPPALSCINFTVQQGETVGIVGRSGAGKTSICMALLRMVDFDGQVFIDGIDSANIGLEELRSQIAIVPQNPVLFSGSVRHNLDPSNRCTDEQIWEVLNAFGIADLVRCFAKGLDETICTDENISYLEFRQRPRQLRKSYNRRKKEELPGPVPSLQPSFRQQTTTTTAASDNSHDEKEYAPTRRRTVSFVCSRRRRDRSDSKPLLLETADAATGAIITDSFRPKSASVCAKRNRRRLSTDSRDRDSQQSQGRQLFYLKKKSQEASRSTDERLSLGQKQLLCFCRAVLKDSRVILLDEASSCVDVGQDSMIFNSLHRHLRDKTVVMITHRLRSVVQHCDRVLVFDHSELVEVGRPSVLLEDKSSRFHDLYYGGVRRLTSEACVL
ncbi:unnamed protein product [Vitrella brassicaformis CCMP3155]|uniref:Uncharacterized protein n=3 Tax=Vitrella brassicaformis TaxID=1169539 RepID=A0A0G4EBA9_VITBC|nr:unnamed protein product [Vitrella brassicaformis CCMP3155]|eukprot:CEL92545.1 unnamed protein product [Vitrella brassicaformis CCMP3155]